MQVSSLGEVGLIDRFSRPFLCDLKKGTVGIGDDCSVVPWDKDFFQLTTTDLLVEDVHFLKKKITPFHLGKKAVSVNVSDVAAMGGRPTGLYLSLGIPGETKLFFVDEFFRGLKEACDHYGVPLLGGDTTGTPGPIIINMTVQGNVERGKVKLRRTAKAGDVICLAGCVGDAGVGLGILTGKWKTNNDRYFINKHHCPRAYLEEGQFLSKWDGVHAMIDLSDSLEKSLQQVCRLSGVGARVNLTCLPCSSPLEEFFSAKTHGDKENFLAVSGEDYGLLVTLSPEAFNLVSEEYQKKFGDTLHRIGEITKGPDIALVKNGKPLLDNLDRYDPIGETAP